MIWEYVGMVCWNMIFLIAAIVLHEVGHILRLKSYSEENNFKVEFKRTGTNIFNRKIDILIKQKKDNLTNEEYRSVLWCGILLGLVPLWIPYFFMIWRVSYIIPIIFTFIYLFGARSDIKNLWVYRK